MLICFCDLFQFDTSPYPLEYGSGAFALCDRSEANRKHRSILFNASIKKCSHDEKNKHNHSHAWQNILFILPESRTIHIQSAHGRLARRGLIVYVWEECEVSRIFDIGHWTFECPMSNIWLTSRSYVWGKGFIGLGDPCFLYHKFANLVSQYQWHSIPANTLLCHTTRNFIKWHNYLVPAYSL